MHVDNFKVCTGCVHLLAVLQSAMLVCACCATLVRQALCGVIGALAAVRAQRMPTATRLMCGLVLWFTLGCIGLCLICPKVSQYLRVLAVPWLPRIYCYVGACVEGLYIVCGG